jgi:hypothetical protein
MGTDKEKGETIEFMAKSRLSFNRNLFLYRFSTAKSPSSFTWSIPIGSASLSVLSVPIREIRGSIPLVAVKIRAKLF